MKTRILESFSSRTIVQITRRDSTQNVSVRELKLHPQTGNLTPLAPTQFAVVKKSELTPVAPEDAKRILEDCQKAVDPQLAVA